MVERGSACPAVFCNSQTACKRRKSKAVDVDCSSGCSQPSGSAVQPKNLGAGHSFFFLCGTFGRLVQTRNLLRSFYLGAVWRARGSNSHDRFLSVHIIADWHSDVGAPLRLTPKIDWRGWVSGSALGALPLLPWLEHARTYQGSVRGFNWQNILSFGYWRHWVCDPLGYGLDYNLGAHNGEFAQQPVVCAILVLIGLLAAGIYSLGIYCSWQNRTTASGADSSLALASVALGCGSLMTLAGIDVVSFYLLITFPFPYYWLSVLACQGRRWGQALLAALIVCQLALTASFLTFIHANHGADGADYGVGYQWQLRMHAAPESQIFCAPPSDIQRYFPSKECPSAD